eukprot:6473472-Prymnesium_polylepis.1
MGRGAACGVGFVRPASPQLMSLCARLTTAHDHARRGRLLWHLLHVRARLPLDRRAARRAPEAHVPAQRAGQLAHSPKFERLWNRRARAGPGVRRQHNGAARTGRWALERPYARAQVENTFFDDLIV